MISHFPNFSFLNIEHQEEIRSICAKTDPYADFNFINLFCWSNGEARVSLLNNNLAIQLPDYISDSTIFSLIGDKKLDESLRELLKISRRLELIPESVIKGLNKPTEFKIIEDVGGHDYVYLIKDIVDLQGKRFKNKRQKLQKIKEVFPNSFEIKTKTDIDEQDKSDMRQVFISWIENHRNHSVEEDAELKAFNILLDSISHFKLAFTFIRYLDNLVAFSVNEVINEKYALCHFEKVVRIHPHLGVLIINEAAKYLLNQGCVYVNWEQDLGIDGLRISKRSYHPEKLFKKYSVTLA
jgi:hypothetical protein